MTWIVLKASLNPNQPTNQPTNQPILISESRDQSNSRLHTFRSTDQDRKFTYTYPQEK